MNYDPEEDSLYIVVRERQVFDSKEIGEETKTITLITVGHRKKIYKL